jgi:hypothetical protein
MVCITAFARSFKCHVLNPQNDRPDSLFNVSSRRVICKLMLEYKTDAVTFERLRDTRHKLH